MTKIKNKLLNIKKCNCKNPVFDTVVSENSMIIKCAHCKCNIDDEIIIEKQCRCQQYRINLADIAIAIKDNYPYISEGICRLLQNANYEDLIKQLSKEKDIQHDKDKHNL